MRSLAKSFGGGFMTRAEYNAYKHACAHHRPRLATICPSAEAGPANKKPRRVVQSLLVQGSASSSSSSSSSSSAGGSPVFFQVVTKKKYAQQNAERTEAALAAASAMAIERELVASSRTLASAGVPFTNGGCA